MNKNAAIQRVLATIASLLVPGLLCAFETPIEYDTGNWPRDVALADLNRDGAIDIVSVVDPGQESVSLLGQGNGRFGDATAFSAGLKPRCIVVADLNRDGLPDLVVGDEGDLDAKVLFGDGEGGFGPAVAYPLPARPRAVAVADLDADGLRDLVVVTQTGVAVLLGGLSGGFAAAVDHPLAVEATDGLVTDATLDGVPDVVVADSAGNRVVVLPGDGAGGFLPAVSLAVGADPRAILAADVTGDAVPDLISANKQTNDVTVLQGDGSGLFLPGVSHSTGQNPEALAWGDFNGDCLPDLAVHDSDSGGQVSVLAGDGAGGFTLSQDVSVSGGGKIIRTADIDGDLRADLVVANGRRHSVMTLRNDNPASCTSFALRRTTDPAAMDTAPVHAYVTSGPFDDDAGSLTDGQSYYYRLDHVGGLPLLLSAHPNKPQSAVRLGFQDGKSDSAAVSGFSTEVTVEPATIPADGVSTARVTIVPRDAAGTPLGSGLTIELDEGLLLPGETTGPLRDLGNGTYAVDVASTSNGVGQVVVSVETLFLASAPTISFVQP